MTYEQGLTLISHHMGLVLNRMRNLQAESQKYNDKR
jgi:hypothetical protein